MWQRGKDQNVPKPYDACNEISESLYVKAFKMKLIAHEMLVLDKFSQYNRL